MNPIDLLLGLLIGLAIGALIGFLLGQRSGQKERQQLVSERDQARAGLEQAQALHEKEREALQREHQAALEAEIRTQENERHRHQAEIATLKEQHRLALEAERRAHAEALKAKDQALSALKETIEKERAQLREAFAALSQDALSKNNESFLKLAQEQLKRLHEAARSELEKKEKGVESLVQPIREALDKTARQLQELEKERSRAFGALDQQLKQLVEAEQRLQRETRNLVQALRRPEVRGQWGEITLHRLVELAGLVDHVDFQEQVHTDDGEGGHLRPDMIVQLPNERKIVVDAKTPLDAYLNAVEAEDDATRDAALQRHARKVRERVKELASKAYWSRFDGSIDFVVLFIPGEQFLTAALERDPELLEDALQRRIILATPTTLVALLRAVAFGWQQEALAQNAEAIRKEGSQLYERLTIFAQHLAKVGRQLNGSVEAYNKAVGSYNSRLLPSAQRFKQMGIDGKRDAALIEPVDEHARSPLLENEPS